MPWFLAAACALVPRAAQAGKLGDMRSEVAGSSSSSDSSSSDGGSSDGDSDSDGSDVGSEAGAALVAALVEFNAAQGRPMFAPYPYRHDHRGWVHRNGSPPARDAPGKPWSLRAAAEGAWFGDGVWRTSIDAEFAWRRLSLRNVTGLYLEPGARDASYLGSAGLYIAAVMRPKAVWRLGLGPGYLIDARRLDDPTRTDAVGIEGSTTLDVFLVRPIVFSARADLGKLGAATTFMTRATVGFAVRRFEGYGGFEYRAVGKVRFGGPVFGVRVWF